MPAQLDDSNWVQELAWPAVERRLVHGAVALLPVGAAAKEHGLHLPMATDYIQAACYASYVAAAVDALIWPVANYGYYPVFTDYPGSISLAAANFVAMIGDILDGIVSAGAARIAILNTGISTIAPLDELLRTRSDRRVCLVNCYAGTRFAAAVAAVEEQPFGGHADEIETALMLALAPAQVALARALPAQTHIARGMFNRRNPQAPNYSPTGANGDPTRATLVKGQRLLQALTADLIEAVRAHAGA